MVFWGTYQCPRPALGDRVKGEVTGGWVARNMQHLHRCLGLGLCEESRVAVRYAQTLAARCRFFCPKTLLLVQRTVEQPVRRKARLRPKRLCP